MKYFILLGDGMADLPVPQLQNKTPLQCAVKPTIDGLALLSEVGMVNITPPGCKGGSDVGNLSVLGYDPRVYLTGRSPLEAASIGITMNDTDVALRCNLVCLSNDEPYENKTMLDYSSDEITTEEASELIAAINQHFKDENIEFFTGISYRHCLIIHNGKDKMTLTPPHNITGKIITDFLPNGDMQETLLEMMKQSFAFLSTHPINIARIKAGKKPANSIWLWGQGRKPALPLFEQKYKKTGAMVTAVDLLKGIANLSGMTNYTVAGATGNLHTNFKGKAEAALMALETHDFVYLHIEAADECGHRFEVENKILAIEKLDEVMKLMIDGLTKKGEDFRLLFMPDHPTPVTTGAHSSDPVPYLLYQSNKHKNGVSTYWEEAAKSTGTLQEVGYTLIDKLLEL